MHAQQIVEPVQEFGPCLKGILKSRKVSASELARMLAYKSRNSIFRVLDETDGHSARQSFYDRLTGEDPLLLSAQEREALYRQNCVQVRTMDAHGRWRRYTLALVDKGVFVTLEDAKCGERDHILDYFSQDLERMQLLKAEIPGSGRLENYLSYTDNCRKLEMNRAAFTVKPDIPLTCVHPDILLPCVRDAFWKMAGDHAEAFIAQKEFCQRYKEFYMQDLLERHVIPREETLALLERLIEIAKNAAYTY